MKIKIKCSLVFFCLFLASGIQSQTKVNENKEIKEYPNLIKKICFLSNGNYYPLTVEISPYGYWFVGDIYLGYNAGAINEYLIRTTFGWVINDTMYNSPRNYIYDTIQADTISSIFKNVRCISKEPKLPVGVSYQDSLINISDSNSFAILVKDFKYSYLLRNMTFSQDSCEIIRCVYPLNVYYPYKTAFAVVELKIWPDSIEMISNSLNTVNLLDIKLEKTDSVLLKKKDFKKLKKTLSKTSFNSDIYCKVCCLPYMKDFDYIIEYRNNDLYYSYFLCEEMRIMIDRKEKNIRKTIDHLSNLYYYIFYLNKYYFGLERKNKPSFTSGKKY